MAVATAAPWSPSAAAVDNRLVPQEPCGYIRGSSMASRAHHLFFPLLHSPRSWLTSLRLSRHIFSPLALSQTNFSALCLLGESLLDSSHRNAWLTFRTATATS